MPRYCVDTSGLSHPYEELPEDIYRSLWRFVREQIASGSMAVTTEIFEEMVRIGGGLGVYIESQKQAMLYEVDQGDWDWVSYIEHTSRMTDLYREHISEYSGGSAKTICLNDLSVIALAKTLELPVVSMERRLLELEQSYKRRIPNICDAENIVHHTFNDFLRLELFEG